MGDLRDRLSPRLLVGVFVILLGVFLTLDSLGFLDFGSVWRFWPVILIVFGLTGLARGGRPVGAIVQILLGVGFLLTTLGLVHLRQFWPVLVILLGVKIAFGALWGEDRWRRRHGAACAPAGPAGMAWASRIPSAGTAASPAAEEPWVPRPDRVDAFSFMGGAKRVVDSAEFRGGQATVIMGACEMDLRDARMPDGNVAVLDVFAFWGGVEIRVPEEWMVDNQLVVAMGPMEDKTRRPAQPKGRLVVRGMVIMGGFEIRN
jgi:hypothetical protein